jgi:acyl-CoA thioesterase I
MRLTSPLHLSRRRLLAAALTAAASPALARAPIRAGIVTLLGDSITAGFGLSAAQALPARLEAELNRLSPPVRVRGAGVSGDTSAGGLARMNFSVQADTDVCVVALGGNDLLQGLNPAATQANLTAIVVGLKRRRIGVVLAGQTAPAAIGSGYARDFNALFARVARAQGVPLYPDLLAGVHGNPALNQRDAIHPNPAGVAIIARSLAPVIVRALAAHRRGPGA